MKAGRLSFAVNRVYYSCFYVVSAALLRKGHKFKKHSGVKAAFHKIFVKTGLVSHEMGIFYDALYEARQRGDYIELISFDKDVVAEWIKNAGKFLDTIKTLLHREKAD